MDCQHAETTTLLWLYGEGPDGHAAHVATCPACQAVVRDHEQVVSALGPALAATAAPERVAPRGRPRLVMVGTLAALAAGLVVWVGVQAPPQAAPTPEAAVVVARPSTDPFDVALDDLDLELDRLSLELEML